jgi:hypothetical protein
VNGPGAKVCRQCKGALPVQAGQAQDESRHNGNGDSVAASEIPSSVQQAENVLAETQESGRFKAGIAGAIFLLVGILWAAAEQDGSSRWVIFGGLPVSWFCIGVGVIGIGSSILQSTGTVETANTRRFHVSQDGVCVKEGSVIPWADISAIYRGGEVLRVNFVKSSETARLRVQSADGREARLEVTARTLEPRVSEAMAQIHRAILGRVAQRQWTEFMNRLQAGHPSHFGAFAIRNDGIFCKKYEKSERPLPFQRVCGYELKSGSIYLGYINEQGKNKSILLGQVAETPNLHILTPFLDNVVSVNRAANQTSN